MLLFTRCQNPEPQTPSNSSYKLTMSPPLTSSVSGDGSGGCRSIYTMVCPQFWGNTLHNPTVLLSFCCISGTNRKKKKTQSWCCLSKLFAHFNHSTKRIPKPYTWATQYNIWEQKIPCNRDWKCLLLLLSLTTQLSFARLEKAWIALNNLH